MLQRNPGGLGGIPRPRPLSYGAQRGKIYGVLLEKEEETSMSAIHGIEMSSITGEPVSLSKFQDNLCLIVNVASR